MGYRSDVAYKIWFDTFENRDAFIDMVLANHDRTLYDALKECEIGAERGIYEGDLRPVISFEAESVKWYGEFADVQMHHDLIRFAEETFGDSNCGARFVRMGESDDDFASDEYGNESLIDYDAIHMSRTLVVEEVQDALTLDQWREKKLKVA